MVKTWQPQRLRDAVGLGVAQGSALGGITLGGWNVATGHVAALPIFAAGVFAAWIWWHDWRFAITPNDKRAQRALPAAPTEEPTPRAD